jgi:hypothetical protein
MQFTLRFLQLQAETCSRRGIPRASWDYGIWYKYRSRPRGSSFGPALSPKIRATSNTGDFSYRRILTRSRPKSPGYFQGFEEVPAVTLPLRSRCTGAVLRSCGEQLSYTPSLGGAMTSYLPRSYNWAQQPIREVQAGRTTHHPGSFTLAITLDRIGDSVWRSIFGVYFQAQDCRGPS